jgi:3-oxoacyl-[acyl-carrier protein] reductase
MMETTNISQRVAAISGAASGIGLALATLYARRGIRVIAGYYPDDPHDPTVAAARVGDWRWRCTLAAAECRRYGVG